METGGVVVDSKVEKWKKILSERMRSWSGLLWRQVWKAGREDPRRVIHSLKVGFSLTLVSLLYLIEPLFKGVGQSAIWAVMTVVVVLEFTAGNYIICIYTYSSI